MPLITWDSKLANAVGAKTAKPLEAAFGHATVGDLLGHYPRAWIPRGQISSLGELVAGEHTTLIGRVTSSAKHSYQDKRTGRIAFRVEVVLELSDGHVWLTFFDRAEGRATWRVNQLAAGVAGRFDGNAEWNRFGNHWQLVHPNSEILERAEALHTDDVVERERARTSALQPIYPANKKLSSWKIESCQRLVLDLIEAVPDLLPPATRLRHALISAQQALEWIHRPDTAEELEAGKNRLRFDEAFVTQTVLARRRAALLRLPARPRTGVAGGLLDRFDQKLPFDLTAGQVEVSKTILEDLAAGHPMHRLLQGEVGSGKTVVALRAMLRVVDSGAQAVLLAPTEVLAQQHHRSINAMLGDLAGGGMLGAAEGATRIALLTGSLGAAARRAAMLDAASGAAGIVIGTHALLEENVMFAELGLVVVDEQHRFGVEQRAALTAKSGDLPPHVLVMTATPIPRTVAMTVFGDLETSTLAELPAGRAAIQTNVVPLAQQPTWLDRAWARIREEVGQGHQAYVVCPRIGDPPDEASHKEGGEDAPAGVVETAAALTDGALRGLRVGVLHGGLTADDKEATMRSFSDGSLDVLVATTVIEVGVDVANATIMVILDADRFGVSQLHQLRGRVGRGGLPGLCLLVTSTGPGSPTRARLEAVAATTDGFELSRLDLQQRREGDVLGTSQSGHRSSLRLLSVLEHEDIIVEARSAAAATIQADPELTGHPELAAAVRSLDETDRADYLEKA